jgi:hypothetical protein
MKPETSADGRKFSWFSVVAQIWMVAVVLIFLVIRVVGSSTGQNFLHKLVAH